MKGRGLGDLGVNRSAVLVDGKELGRESAEWRHCFQERVYFRLCEMGMNLWVSQKAGGRGGFLDKLSKCRFSRRVLLHDARVMWTV